MLSRQDNELLTSVGATTPMGELLRRYWMPACLSSELGDPDGPPVRVRLLGEQLVAFRDSNGDVGLIEEQCPHRGASLFFGRNEGCGLRCVYHGWKFDVTGQCVDQRSERRSFADRIRVTAYPTHESGGIVWAYLGPAGTVTPFRDFGIETLAPEHVSASKELVRCSWVQSLDGEADTTHISNLHQWEAAGQLPDDGTDRPGYPSNLMSVRFWAHDPAAQLEMQETWYGFRYAGIRRTPNGHRHARITAFILPTTALIASVPFGTRHIMHAPIDDTSTYRYTFSTQPPNRLAQELGGTPFFKVPGYPYGEDRSRTTNGIIQRAYTADNDYGIDRDRQKSVTFSGIGDFKAQDNMVTETAGPVYDRTREHLGSGDVAVIKLHQALLSAAKALSEGNADALPALAGQGDFRGVRSAEKVLDDGEDWRALGTDEDPTVQAAGLAAPAATGNGKGERLGATPELL